MQADVVVVGAGASGLMAARILAETGKKVVILEARERIGGRIYSLPKEDFGYEAMGGGEFVHGDAPLTQALIEEIGLHLEHGIEWWNVFDGEPKINNGTIPASPRDTVLEKALSALEKDMTLVEFFDAYLPGPQHQALREYTFKRVASYDAADPAKASAVSLRDEIESDTGSKQHSIKEGYAPLLRHLEEKCKASDVEIELDKPVVKIEYASSEAVVTCRDGSSYTAGKVIVTVPLPCIKDIEYVPALPEKLAATAHIGFGSVIKVLLNFKTKWWSSPEREADFERMFFMFSNEAIPTWWTQYPEPYLTLTGWLAGPQAEATQQLKDEEILAVTLTSLSNIFKISIDELKRELLASKVCAWGRDPYAKGAYSYYMPGTHEAIEELNKPVNNKLYFAGEALYLGEENGTVEAALVTGKEAAEKILRQ